MKPHLKRLCTTKGLRYWTCCAPMKYTDLVVHGNGDTPAKAYAELQKVLGTNARHEWR